MAQDQFAAAVADSHLLLAFLSRRSISMDDRDRAQFKNYADSMARVQAQVAANKTVTDQDRASFWESFIWLSNLASPATIESIRYYFHYYYHKRKPFWAAARDAVLRPGQRAKNGGRWVFSVSTIFIFVLTLILSLAGFVGNRTIEQFSKDYRHWYQIATIARSVAYGYTVEAAYDKNDRDVTLYLRPPEKHTTGSETASYRIVQRTSADVALPSIESAVQSPTPKLTQLHIPEERVLQMRSAFPQIFAGGSTIERLDQWVWTPACLQPAFGDDQLPPGRSGTTPCVHVSDIVLAEELTATLTGMNTEREILGWLLKPITMVESWIAPPEKTEPRQTPTVPPAPANQPYAETELDRCPALPTHLPDAEQMKIGVRDPLRMNRIFLTIICRQLPMPTVLPPPLQNMLDMPFKARLTLDVLNTYILALMFGLLGASVHIMRDIHRRLDDFTLTRVLLSRYKTRLILGAVAGPFIGLFFNPPEGVTDSLNSTPELVSHLTGLGLAFLAGFSVEVLFSILDRLTTLLSEISTGTHAGQPAVSQRPAGPSLH